MSNVSDLPTMPPDRNAMSEHTVRQGSNTRSHVPRLAGRRYSRLMLNRFPSRGYDVSHLCLKMSQALDDFNSRPGQSEAPIFPERQRHVEVESAHGSQPENVPRNNPIPRKRPACQDTPDTDNPRYNTGMGTNHRRLVRQRAFRLKEDEDLKTLFNYDSESSCITQT